MSKPQNMLVVALVCCIIIVLLMRGAIAPAGILAGLLFLNRAVSWVMRGLYLKNAYQQFKYHQQTKQQGGAKKPSGNIRMSVDEARAILDIEGELTKPIIKKAYQDMMKRNHPDQGGSKYIAAQINSARETLIKEIED